MNTGEDHHNIRGTDPQTMCNLCAKNPRTLFQAPIDPMADISKVSAPLKIFLISKLGFKAKPKDCILLCDASALNPNPNFLSGVNLMMFDSV